MGHDVKRVTRSRRSAQASYDRLSRWYDALAAGSEGRFMRAGLRLLNVQPGERVLDIGCGTGRAVVALTAAVGERGLVLGVDLSPRMISATRASAQRAGQSARIELCCADAVALPLAADSLDAALMSFTLELFDTPEIPLVLAECRRVLRVGGRLCVVAMSRPASPGLAVRLYEWLHDRFPRTLDCRPIHARESVAESGLQVLEASEGSMVGLPVEVVLAAKRECARDAE